MVKIGDRFGVHRERREYPHTLTVAPRRRDGNREAQHISIMMSRLGDKMWEELEEGS